VTAATTNSGNMLDDSTTTNGLKFVASYSDGGGAAASTVGTIDLATKSLIDVTTSTGALQAAKATGSATATDFTALTASDVGTNNAVTLSNIDKAIADVTSYSALVGSTSARVTEQQSFVASQQTNLTNSVSTMVDADMNAVSTRLSALQTQQQLGVQSLSIANQSTSMILKLFQ
jgi:flagellin